MKTINNPNPIDKMKTTNNPNPIASIGRINFKKVISAILLFSLLLFSLLAGANSLQAQERKKCNYHRLVCGHKSLCNGSKSQKNNQTKKRSFLGVGAIIDATVPNFALDATIRTKFCDLVWR